MISPILYIASLITVSLIALYVGMRYSDKLTILTHERLTLTESEQRVKDLIISNDKYSQGKRDFVLTQFREDLVLFAEKDGYKGRIPVQKSLSEYISPNNQGRRDPALMKLCIKMMEGKVVRIIDKAS